MGPVARQNEDYRPWKWGTWRAILRVKEPDLLLGMIVVMVYRRGVHMAVPRSVPVCARQVLQA
jgi:hypothetical protein